MSKSSSYNLGPPYFYPPSSPSSSPGKAASRHANEEDPESIPGSFDGIKSWVHLGKVAGLTYLAVALNSPPPTTKEENKSTPSCHPSVVPFAAGSYSTDSFPTLSSEESVGSDYASRPSSSVTPTQPSFPAAAEPGMPATPPATSVTPSSPIVPGSSGRPSTSTGLTAPSTEDVDFPGDDFDKSFAVMRTADCSSFYFDFEKLSARLAKGPVTVTSGSEGNNGPTHYVTISQDQHVEGTVNFDVNLPPTTASTSSSRPIPALGILRSPQQQHAASSSEYDSAPTKPDVYPTYPTMTEKSTGKPSLVDLASQAGLSYGGPILSMEDIPKTGDDGQRILPDVDIYDYCTSLNGLKGLDKPLRAAENMASWIQDRYRRSSDLSRILDREDARYLAKDILRSSNDGRDISRFLVAKGLDDRVINSVLPERDELFELSSVIIDDTPVPTIDEAGSGIDVSAWDGQSLDAWLRQRVPPSTGSDWQSDAAILASGREFLDNVRSLGDQMTSRHGLDPTLSTYLATRIGTFMTDQIIHSGMSTPEVTRQSLSEADQLMVKAKAVLSAMSTAERESVLRGGTATAGTESSVGSTAPGQSATSSPWQSSDPSWLDSETRPSQLNREPASSLGSGSVPGRVSKTPQRHVSFDPTVYEQ